MYVLYPKDPETQQRNRKYRWFDEGIRLQGVIAVCRTQHLRDYMCREEGFMDVTEKMLDRLAAAQALGVPVPLVDAWSRNGRLKNYAGLFFPMDVESLVLERGVA